MSRLKLVEPRFTPWTRFWPPMAPKDVQLDANLGFGYTDEIKSAANAQHSEALFSYLFQPDEVEDMIRTTRQEIAKCVDWIRLG